jgi:tetratricopeptide (TPR) repeat protein
LSPDDSPLRARVTSRLAEAVTFSPARTHGADLSDQAIAMGRRLEDRSTIAYVLERAHWATWGPDNLDQRLAVATEIIDLAEKAGDISSVMQTRVWRLSHLLEQGDIAAVDAEYEACRELAARLRQPYNLWQVATIEATVALLEGRFSEVEQLAQRALAIGMEAKNRNAVALCGVQVLALRREEGRLHELEAGMAEFVDQYPGIPGWRTGLAWLHTELGHEDEARREFERMAVSDFAGFPHDMFWLKSMTLLAEVCTRLGDAQRAAVLYEALMPYADRCIVDAPVAACSGSVQRLLGCLAATLSRYDDAASHFEAALEVNSQIRARPWVAHTQYEYARMLFAREPAGGAKARELLSEALAGAEEMEMKALTARTQALRQQAEAVAAG